MIPWSPRRSVRATGSTAPAHVRRCRAVAPPHRVATARVPSPVPEEPTGPDGPETAHLEEVVTAVAAPGLWAAAMTLAPAAPVRGVLLAAGWVGIATVLRRRGDRGARR